MPETLGILHASHSLTGQPLKKREGEISAGQREPWSEYRLFPVKLKDKQNQVGGSRFLIPKEKTEKLRKLISGSQCD